ncbi:MAG: hypothetical protein KAI66_20890, partial [Lentisphaeria bacterium]|nr:hypothetical protein [Lentisphaeria bacterium]
MMFRHWRNWLLILNMAFLATAHAAKPVNLLVNPGFEQTGVGGLPQAWRRHAGKAPGLDRSLVGDSRTGERAVLLDDQVGGKGATEHTASTGIAQKVVARAGTWYRASVWAKCLARSNRRDAWLQLRFHPSRKRVNRHLDRALPEGDWQRVELFAEAPEGTTHAEFIVKTLHSGTCRYIIDDAKLTVFEGGGDDQRLALVATGHQAIETVRKPNLFTPIVKGGKALARIAVCDEPEWQALGKTLQSELHARAAVKVPIIVPTRELLRSPQTIIAIGHITNNPVVERLWLNRYQEVNLLRPGPGEYILQLIPEPYDAPLGTNMILIGASDATGAAKGVARLLELLGAGPELALREWVLEISNDKPMSAKDRNKLLKRKRSKFWLKDFWQAARNYQKTADPAYAEQSRLILLQIAKRYRDYGAGRNLLKHWPAPTSAHQFRVYWSEETTAEWIGSMWDFIDDAPVFSEEERWICTNALLSTCHDLTRHVSWWKTLAKDDTVDPVAFNHTTFPLLGVYFLARYYKRNYDGVDPLIDEYLARCQRCFGAQMKSWKPSEDATAYCSIVPKHVTTWSLAEGDYSFMESGRYERFQDYTAAFCDSTGDAASFGDNGYGRSKYTRGF